MGVALQSPRGATIAEASMKILTSTSLLRSTRLTASFTASVGDVTLSGHRLEVACQCGVTFERWVTTRRTRWTICSENACAPNGTDHRE